MKFHIILMSVRITPTLNCKFESLNRRNFTSFADFESLKSDFTTPESNFEPNLRLSEKEKQKTESKTGMLKLEGMTHPQFRTYTGLTFAPHQDVDPQNLPRSTHQAVSGHTHAYSVQWKL